jgi:Xaa-Pro dipeptidase
MSFDFKRRLTGLQQKMEEHDLDLVVFGSCQNFQYLTGLLVDWRHGIDLGSPANNVFVSREGEPIVTVGEEWSKTASQGWIKDVRTLGEKDSFENFTKKTLSDLNVKVGRVGIGDHVWGSTITELNKAMKNPVFLKTEHLLDKIRMIKDPGEIERLRKVATLTDKTVEAVLPHIKKDATQKELRIEVEYQAKRLGASDVSFAPWIGFIKSGSEKTKDPTSYPKDKGLEPKTSIAFDIGFVLDGYCSDFGRSFYFGPAKADVKRGYEALQQSVVETVDKMCAGRMRVSDVFPAIEKILDKLGYGNYLRTRLPNRSVGHNIGIEVHEPPWLDPNYEDPLQSNMAMAVEPKLWNSGEYYFRVEDIVLIGSHKAESLTQFDRELFQL